VVDNKCGERLATLEEKARVVEEDMVEIKEGLDAIQSTLTKQRGFWAGVTFVITLAAFFARELWMRVTT